jgi:hypothetical protein
MADIDGLIVAGTCGGGSWTAFTYREQTNALVEGGFKPHGLIATVQCTSHWSMSTQFKARYLYSVKPG